MRSVSIYHRLGSKLLTSKIIFLLIFLSRARVEFHSSHAASISTASTNVAFKELDFFELAVSADERFDLIYDYTLVHSSIYGIYVYSLSQLLRRNISVSAR
jgi:hypothetical protein